MSFGAPTAGTMSWFARHEFNLTWRDFVRMMSAGKAGKEKAVIAFMIFAVCVVHVIAFFTLKPVLEAGFVVNKAALTAITTSLILTLSLMLSQSMEQVTRVFYARSDLDLILSSPVSATKIFAVRMTAIAVTTSLLSLILFGSAINVMAVFDSPIWLAAYLVIFACGFLATGISLAITIFMFRTLGAKRTRLIAQIVAAVIGAGFVIGIQVAAIVSLGSISRIDFLLSDQVAQYAPAISSHLWIPAQAVMGNTWQLAVTVLVMLTVFYVSVRTFSNNFGEHVLNAAGISQTKTFHTNSDVNFKPLSKRATLRHKEWKLLLRDHWLLSQTLMQILYLIPPAVLLWMNWGGSSGIGIVVLPVLVMATGQLAGGLAWLAISGEDAPDLVKTSPVPENAIIRAKIEAVLGAIGIIVAPILIILTFFDFRLTFIAAMGIAASAVSATMIQLWFRSQANRSNFRRRQTSSKVATFSEAFSSIMWAGTTGVAAAGSILFILMIPLPLLILWIARKFRPQLEN
ncbi:MAG: putative ABC exporter domain-containing protein [Pseudomonadota bacterium]